MIYSNYDIPLTATVRFTVIYRVATEAAVHS